MAPIEDIFPVNEAFTFLLETGCVARGIQMVTSKGYPVVLLDVLFLLC